MPAALEERHALRQGPGACGACAGVAQVRDGALVEPAADPAAARVGRHRGAELADGRLGRVPGHVRPPVPDHAPAFLGDPDPELRLRRLRPVPVHDRGLGHDVRRVGLAQERDDAGRVVLAELADHGLESGSHRSRMEARPRAGPDMARDSPIARPGPDPGRTAHRGAPSSLRQTPVRPCTAARRGTEGASFGLDRRTARCSRPRPGNAARLGTRRNQGRTLVTRRIAVRRETRVRPRLYGAPRQERDQGQTLVVRRTAVRDCTGLGRSGRLAVASRRRHDRVMSQRGDDGEAKAAPAREQARSEATTEASSRRRRAGHRSLRRLRLQRGLRGLREVARSARPLDRIWSVRSYWLRGGEGVTWARIAVGPRRRQGRRRCVGTGPRIPCRPGARASARHRPVAGGARRDCARSPGRAARRAARARSRGP